MKEDVQGPTSIMSADSDQVCVSANLAAWARLMRGFRTPRTLQRFTLVGIFPHTCEIFCVAVSPGLVPFLAFTLLLGMSVDLVRLTSNSQLLNWLGGDS
jgi:hypothetical protein